ncbi:hypothetical protein MCG98_14900 [Ruminococcus sp. OA3]|uniref:YiiX/YebB-like N1pC/P60 family cysteine hydrolase n=1 Tax=Ruminococcus sp. OA3 TaxID=2914164 RepID=UPI001F061107|nr:YiiX/YebB-like N1pC/P60 family cysteine hydrolase [Ruminococcus sp. OA3]MCH1983858.1 hypothetical protein [Ruminococcus sp. OA3]
MKKKVCILLIAILVVLLSLEFDNYTYAAVNDSAEVILDIEDISETNEMSELEKAYQEINNYIIQNNLPAEITWEQFLQEFELIGNSDVQQYKNKYIDLFSIQQEENPKLRNNKPWFYDTKEELPIKANYSNYNLLSTVKKGDILFEARGGFYITGHIAIVEGIFYSEQQDQEYIRVIEATSYGVIRSVVDDDRYDSRLGVFLRAPNATANIIDSAVDFCISQLGKPYYLDFMLDLEENQPDWYCSELVWAAYFRNGIDLENWSSLSEPGITPRDILSGIFDGRVEQIHDSEAVNITIDELVPYNDHIEVYYSYEFTIYDMKSYKIYRSEDRVHWNEIAETNDGYYSDYDVQINKEYFYRVVGYNYEETPSNPSNIENVIIRCDTIPVPTLRIENREETAITLSFYAEQGVTYFNIYRSMFNSDNFKKIATVEAEEKYYTDTGLRSGNTYYYKISAVYSGLGTTNFSNIKNTKAKLTTPILHVSKYNKEGMRLDPFLNGATSFDIYRADSVDGNYEKIATIPCENNLAWYMDNDNLEYNHEYFYKVQGFNEYDESAFSNSASAKTELGNISIVTRGDKKGIRIFWNILEETNRQVLSVSEKNSDGTGYTEIARTELDKTTSTYFLSSTKYNLKPDTVYIITILEYSNDNYASRRDSKTYLPNNPDYSSKINLNYTNKTDGVNVTWNKLDNTSTQKLVIYECKKNSSIDDGFNYKFLDDITLNNNINTYLFSKSKYQLKTSNEYQYTILIYVYNTEGSYLANSVMVSVK